MPHNPSRRLCLLGLAALPLVGCGFRLREAPQFTFRTLWIGGSGPLNDGIKKELRYSSDLQVVPDAPDAEVLLDILADNRRRLVVGQTTAGQVREIELYETVTFRIRRRGVEQPLSEGELEQYRELSYNESQALGKDMEESMLYDEMRRNIVQQIVRRLAAVPAPQ